MKTIILKKNEERRLRAGHLWVYSNEIDTKITPLSNFQPGELVSFRSANNKNLGVGYINPNTLLCARLLTRKHDAIIDQNFFASRIKQALALREMCFNEPYYRLIFGEGDNLPGLVVDRFGDVLVVQLNSAGMELLKNIIITALIEVLQPTGIVLRNDNNIRSTENLPRYVEVAYGKAEEVVTLTENGSKFAVNLLSGQKTGWFYDQRLNRTHLQKYALNKKVLDVFSYVGSFAINAAVAGATTVTCIDTAKAAADQIKTNAALNNVSTKVDTITDDAFSALSNLQGTFYDIIILDPPAFIKRRKDIATGTEAYLKLHKLALKLLAPNGLLFTTSCSLHLTRDMLLDVVRQAALHEQCDLRVIEQLHQAEDHPVHPAIEETNYLKGFILYQD